MILYCLGTRENKIQINRKKRKFSISGVAKVKFLKSTVAKMYTGMNILLDQKSKEPKNFVAWALQTASIWMQSLMFDDLRALKEIKIDSNLIFLPLGCRELEF